MKELEELKAQVMELSAKYNLNITIQMLLLQEIRETSDRIQTGIIETEIVSDVTCVLKIVTRAVTTVISASLWTTTVEGANTEELEMNLCQKTVSSYFGEQGRDNNSFFSCF